MKLLYRDYLRRANAGGFLLPLSGGADSAAVAAIVRLVSMLTEISHVYMVDVRLYRAEYHVSWRRGRRCRATSRW